MSLFTYVTFEIENSKTLSRSMKNYLEKISMEKLRSIEFSDYSSNNWVNDAHQNFVSKFLQAADSVAPARTIRVQSNTNPWFDIDVLQAIRNCDTHYKKPKQSSKEIDNNNFKNVRFLLEKIINNKKNCRK